MAKGIWISENEREKILQLRKNGMPVSIIAKRMERSTNFIYRILKKANGTTTVQQQTKTRQETCSSLAINGISLRPLGAAGQSHDERNPLKIQDLTDSNAALVYAVDGMEVSPYEPIPMPLPQSVKTFEQRGSQVQQSQCGRLDATVGFVNAPVLPNAVTTRNDKASDQLSLLIDTTSSCCAPSSSSDTSRRHQEQRQLSLQPLKKQKTLTATCQDPVRKNTQPASIPTSSSSLLAHPQLQHSQTAKNMTPDSTDRLNKLLKRIQDEIRRLEGSNLSDVYDAQLLQMLVKFHAEILLMQLQRALFDAESSKRAKDTADDDGNETSRLLREKLAKEIALLNVQAHRETLELERERIRHRTTSMICRKTLLDANTPQADVDQLFSHQ